MFQAFLFGVLIAGVTPLFAQDVPTWTKLGGPFGGLGYDIRIDPTHHDLFFMTDNWSGVNKSTNRGALWSSSNQGITSRTGQSGDAIPIFSLTIDPNNPKIIWAGTAAEPAGAFGFFKSTDGGQTWTDMSRGLNEIFNTGLAIRGFTIQKGNSNVVYAQAELATENQGKEFNKTEGRVFKTTDGGQTWTTFLKTENLSRHLRIHPDNPNILYVSTGIFDREAANSNCVSGVPGGVGILKSTDGGQTWAPANGSGNNTITDLYCGYLAMHPTDPDTLIAACGNNACSNEESRGAEAAPGLFRTEDGGQNWTRVISGYTMTAITFSQSNPSLTYAGNDLFIFKSTNGGKTWTQQNSESSWGPEGVRAGFPIDMIVDRDDDNILYINNYGGGVFKSIDGGKTWVQWNNGFSGAEIHDLSVDLTYPARIWAIGRSGPFVSTNGGETWTGIGTGDAKGVPEWYAIEQDPKNNQVVIMSDEHQGKLFRSTNGGKTFSNVFTLPGVEASDPNTRYGFKALAFDPTNSDVIYTGSCRAGHPSNPENVIAFGLYKSTDNGKNWSAIGATSLGTKCIYTIAVDPTRSSTLYVGTPDAGIYKSTDAGETWSNIGPGTIDIHALAIDPVDNNTIYAGSVKSGGIYKSTDGGQTWTAINTGLTSPNTPIMAIVIDPNTPSTLYAGDWTKGVYKSTDKGETWSLINTGLSTRAVKTLSLNATNNMIFAGTHGEGVFRLGTFSFGQLSGKTTTTKNEILSGVLITVTSANITTTSTTPGTYSFSRVLPGTYTVTAAKSGYADQSASVTLTTDAVETLNFILEEGESSLPESETDDGDSKLPGCNCGFIDSDHPGPPPGTGLLLLVLGIGLGFIVSRKLLQYAHASTPHSSSLT